MEVSIIIIYSNFNSAIYLNWILIVLPIVIFSINTIHDHVEW